MPYLYTHLLPDAWAVSMLGCVKECLLWVFIDKLPCGHVFWVLLALHPGVELLSHIVTLCRGIFLKFLQHLYDEENKTKQNKTMGFFFFCIKMKLPFYFYFIFFSPEVLEAHSQASLFGKLWSCFPKRPAKHPDSSSSTFSSLLVSSWWSLSRRRLSPWLWFECCPVSCALVGIGYWLLKNVCLALGQLICIFF